MGSCCMYSTQTVGAKVITALLAIMMWVYKAEVLQELLPSCEMLIQWSSFASATLYVA